MSVSYELHLFRPKPTAAPAEAPTGIAALGDELAVLDAEAVGDFLLAMGPSIRFAARTALGGQYIYEDEAGCILEIMVSEKQISIGGPAWPRGAQSERTKRVADAVALALVARFDLTLYDPQRGRFIRASRDRG